MYKMHKTRIKHNNHWAYCTIDIMFIVQLAQPPRTCVLRPPPGGGWGRVFNYLIFNKKGRLQLNFNNTYNIYIYI
jgi:hypothetical protein